MVVADDVVDRDTVDGVVDALARCCLYSWSLLVTTSTAGANK